MLDETPEEAMVGFIQRNQPARALAVACLGAALLVGCEQLEGMGGEERGQPSEPMGQTTGPESQQGAEEQSGYAQNNPASPLGRAQAQDVPGSEQPVPFDQQEPAPSEEPPYQRQQIEDQPMHQEMQQEQELPPPEPGQQPEAQRSQPQGGSGEGALIRGTVEGTARSIDLARGSVTIESGGQEVSLQAHPSDLERIDVGERVELEFTSYPDGSQWIEPTADARDVLRASDSVGQLTGQIEAIDEDAGIVAVGGQTFRAHPEQLEDLEPGESVSLSYAEVEETPWIAEVEGGGQGRVAQAEPQPQPEPLDEEHTASDIDWEFIN